MSKIKEKIEESVTTLLKESSSTLDSCIAQLQGKSKDVESLSPEHVIGLIDSGSLGSFHQEGADVVFGMLKSLPPNLFACIQDVEQWTTNEVSQDNKYFMITDINGPEIVSGDDLASLVPYAFEK
jgi:hypothetical protein